MKDTRVNVRIPVAEKDLWQQVAKTHGLTLSELVTRSVRSTVLNLQTRITASNATNSASSFTTYTDSGNTAAGAFGSTGYVVWDVPPTKEDEQ